MIQVISMIMFIHHHLARMATVFGLVFSLHAAGDGIQIIPIEIEGKRVIALSVEQGTAPTKQVLPEASIYLETERNWQRFVADTSKGKTYSDWFQRTGSKPWIAFDEQDRKFSTLAHRVKVIATDYAKLEAITRRMGAIRTKTFHSLNYALVWLPKSLNPARVAIDLKREHIVKDAQVQYKRLPVVPM